MARFGHVHHDGTPFPGGFTEGVGRLSERTVHSAGVSLQWAVDTIAAAQKARASTDVIDMVAAMVEPEVSAVAAFLRDRERDTGADSDRDGSPAVQLERDGAQVGVELGPEPLQVLEGTSRGFGVESVSDARVVERDGTSHDASPSAGESAVPGQAGTVSVGGEPAAGGPNAGTPAATRGDAPVRPLIAAAWADRLESQTHAVRGCLRTLAHPSTTGDHRTSTLAVLDARRAELRALLDGRPAGTNSHRVVAALHALTDATAALAETSAES